MKSIIFDIDGTLWDIRHVAAKAWQDAIRSMTDWPITFDAERLGSLFGKPMDVIFFTLYPEISAEEFAPVKEVIYHNEHAYLRELKPELYEGVRETLKILSGRYDLYIVTNAQCGYIETLFDATGIKVYFKDWMCYGDTLAPKNVTISELMKRNNINPCDAVYVGDTEGDAEACRLAGIPIIYAAYGLGKVENPRLSINKPSELVDIFMHDTEAVIFDLDGTLLDTLSDLTDAVNYAMRSFGLPERSLDEVRQFVGNGVAKLIERAIGPESELSADKKSEVLACFKEYSAKHNLDKTAMYDGIDDLLADLRIRGYHMAVVSNKLDSAVKSLNDHFFSDNIPVAKGECEEKGIAKKPAPDMVYAALADLGVKKAVYVGDSEVDIATAANSGLEHIVVEWGFRTRGELLNAGGKYFATEPSDVLKLLK